MDTFSKTVSVFALKVNSNKTGNASINPSAKKDSFGMEKNVTLLLVNQDNPLTTVVDVARLQSTNVLLELIGMDIDAFISLTSAPLV